MTEHFVPTPSLARGRCQSCGSAVGPDWNHCEACGAALAAASSGVRDDDPPTLARSSEPVEPITSQAPVGDDDRPTLASSSEPVEPITTQAPAPGVGPAGVVGDGAPPISSDHRRPHARLSLDEVSKRVQAHLSTGSVGAVVDRMFASLRDRPDRYGSTTEWVVAGMRRFPRACVVTYLWVYVFPAVMVMLGHGILGSGFFTGLKYLVIWTVAGLLWGALVVFWGLLREPARLRRDGHRRMSLREQDQIVHALERCSKEMGVGRLPKLLVSDSRDPEMWGNAMATSRYIVVSKDLLRQGKQNPDILLGVLSHELAHWYYADPLGSAAVRALGWAVIAPYNFFASLTGRLSTWGKQVGGQSGQYTQIGSAFASWIAKAYEVPLKYVIYPALMADSRMVEFSCDQASVVVGEDARRGVISFLEDAVWTESAPTAWDEIRLASHPHSELRIEALESPDEMTSHPALSEPHLVPHAQVSPEHVGVREPIWWR